MKILMVLGLIAAFMNTVYGQEPALVADGTIERPFKHALQPLVEELSAAETEAVKAAALATTVEIASERRAMTSEESNYRQDFALLDAADGFFVSREIRFRAYLYTAYSRPMSRNYQGVIVLRALANRTKFTVAAHYVYEFRDDRYLRELPDIDADGLSELAVYGAPPTKKIYRREVRLLEFAPGGLNKLGRRELYSSEPQKQLSPIGSGSKRVFIPPVVKAVKLYVRQEMGAAPVFYEENWRQTKDDFWGRTDKLARRPAVLEEDQTAYMEIVKPVFPKGPSEK